MKVLSPLNKMKTRKKGAIGACLINQGLSLNNQGADVTCCTLHEERRNLIGREPVLNRERTRSKQGVYPYRKISQRAGK